MMHFTLIGERPSVNTRNRAEPGHMVRSISDAFEGAWVVRTAVELSFRLCLSQTYDDKGPMRRHSLNAGRCR